MRLLIDPGILVAPGERALHQRYWERLVDWSLDSRAYLGEHSQKRVLDSFAEYGYPHNELNLHPPALRGAFSRALNIVLSRVAQLNGEDAEVRSFAPPYRGDYEHGRALGRDVAGTLHLPIGGIATVVDSWDDEVTQVDCVPSPPAELHLCREPGLQLPAEFDAAVAAFFSTRRVHIVGGRPEERVVRRIEEGPLALAGRLSWIPSEKNKPPRGLDRSWSGLSPDIDVTVCITGRIGHAASGKAATVAMSRGVAHLKVESANGIESALIGYFRARSLEPGE